MCIWKLLPMPVDSKQHCTYMLRMQQRNQFFLFWVYEERSKSKCALCVFPNEVCAHSMGFNPPPPAVPTFPPSPSESSSIMLVRSIFLPATKLIQETSNLSIEDSTSEKNMELTTLFVNNNSDVEIYSTIKNEDVSLSCLTSSFIIIIFFSQ